VRIISATHDDMETAIVEGRFRAYLCHGSCVLQIDEAPLRARGEDIELLAKRILDRFKKNVSRRLRGFAPDALAAIANYERTGNVRELTNRARRAVACRKGGRLARATTYSASMWNRLRAACASTTSCRTAVYRTRLLRNRDRVGDAAQELGISRVTLYRLLTAHGCGRRLINRSPMVILHTINVYQAY
jgi:DNA-binding NtrC family response regulator